MEKIKNIIRVLTFLKVSFDAKSTMDYKRLEILYNSTFFRDDDENANHLMGGDFLKLLQELKEKELIKLIRKSGYSITQKGIDYLKENKS